MILMSKLDNVKNNKQVEAINYTSKYQKFKQNIAVKATAFILAVIMLMLTAVCAIGAVGMVATELNTEKGYFKGLDRQELAGNSDHYPFAQRNVPCIFFMNEGGDAFKYYHTIYDTWSNSIFSSYEPTFKLLIDFVEQYK